MSTTSWVNILAHVCTIYQYHLWLSKAVTTGLRKKNDIVFPRLSVFESIKTTATWGRAFIFRTARYMCTKFLCKEMLKNLNKWWRKSGLINILLTLFPSIFAATRNIPTVYGLQKQSKYIRLQSFLLPTYIIRFSYFLATATIAMFKTHFASLYPDKVSALLQT